MSSSSSSSSSSALPIDRDESPTQPFPPTPVPELGTDLVGARNLDATCAMLTTVAVAARDPYIAAFCNELIIPTDTNPQGGFPSELKKQRKTAYKKEFSHMKSNETGITLTMNHTETLCAMIYWTNQTGVNSDLRKAKLQLLAMEYTNVWNSWDSKGQPMKIKDESVSRILALLIRCIKVEMKCMWFHQGPTLTTFVDDCLLTSGMIWCKLQSECLQCEEDPSNTDPTQEYLRMTSIDVKLDSRQPEQSEQVIPLSVAIRQLFDPVVTDQRCYAEYPNNTKAIKIPFFPVLHSRTITQLPVSFIVEWEGAIACTLGEIITIGPTNISKLTEQYELVAVIERLPPIIIDSIAHFISYVKRGDTWWKQNDNTYKRLEGPISLGTKQKKWTKDNHPAYFFIFQRL